MFLPEEIKHQIVKQYDLSIEKKKEAVKTELFWKEFDRLSKADYALATLIFLEKETPRRQKWQAEKYPASETIEKTFLIALEESKRILREFPKLFEQACKEANLMLDATSQHPQYSLDSGFLQIKIIEPRFQASITDYEERLGQFPADIQVIIDKISAERQRLFNRPFNATLFLQLLREAYKSILNKDHLEDGASLPIRDIAQRILKNKKGYKIDEFLVDLSLLVQSGPFEIDSRTLDLQQTKDTKKGMLLYKASERGYIGYLLFRR